MIARLDFAHVPTPLWHHTELDRIVGCEVWVKRDDMTSGAAAGNKIRKLEYLLADARGRRADVVITCGGIQSNHARATALLAAEIGMTSVLYLRVADPTVPVEPVGNVLLDRMVGAEIRLITPDDYRRRRDVMAAAADAIAASGRLAYVIPEGGSNGLGSLGYVRAMREVEAQLARGAAGGAPFDAVAHACGSGGTLAGVALGLGVTRVAPRALAFAVCDSRSYFDAAVKPMIAEARALAEDLAPPAPFDVLDEWKGPAYGIASEEQKAFIVDVARHTGLVLDPVYTGKALFGLSRMAERPARVLFLHTGGLPGLLAQSADLAPALDA